MIRNMSGTAVFLWALLIGVLVTLALVWLLLAGTTVTISP